MSFSAASQLRTAFLLTLLGGALLLGSSLTASAAAGSKGNPPKLLWKTYPLKQRPSDPVETAIHQSPRNQPTAVLQPSLKTATGRTLVLILSLSAILLLGVASLPQAAFANPEFAEALVRWRWAVAAAGVVLFLASVIAVT
jgi:hypothetical protein